MPSVICRNVAMCHYQVACTISVDGICEEIPAGTVTITVSAGLCKGQTIAGESYLGWNSWLNVLAAETFVDREIL